KGRRLFFNEARLAGLEKTVEERGDDRVYRFRALDVPKIDPEPAMPGFTEVAAYVHVSTFESWQDLATWYTGLVKEQLVANSAIAQAARAAVAKMGPKDELGRIRAIYDLVVT